MRLGTRAIKGDRDRWMNSGQAADYIGFRLATIHNMTSRGEIPYRKVRGRLRFLKSELDEWMEEQWEKGEEMEAARAEERGISAESEAQPAPAGAVA